MSTRKTALITGASSGIGKEFAKQLAARDYNLILVARREDRLRELGDALSAGKGIDCLPVPMDLNEPGAVKALMSNVTDAGWTVDLGINSAGFGLRTRFHEGPLERQLDMIDLNCRVLTELSHMCINHMIKHRAGKADGLINVASLAAWQPGPWMAVYFATKAFVLHLSEAMHEEVKDKGLTVSALCPGGTITEFGDIADMADAPTLKVGAMMPPEVVRSALRGFHARRPVVVPGLSNSLAAFGTRFAPRHIKRIMAGKIMAPRS